MVDWITGAGMFCVVNIHWDGGWIDSDDKDEFPNTFATFSAEAEKKFRSYWEQISTFFAGKNEKLIFESLNEETNFSNEGSTAKAYATLTRVNQLFIDTVRKTGGNNAKRLLIIAGLQHRHHEDLQQRLPAAQGHRSRPAVHLGALLHALPVLRPDRGRRLGEDDADLGKPRRREAAGAALRRDEGLLHPQRHPGLHRRVRRGDQARTPTSRVRWMSAVCNARRSRAEWCRCSGTPGREVSRHDPYAASPELAQTLKSLAPAPAPAEPRFVPHRPLRPRRSPAERRRREAHVFARCAGGWRPRWSRSSRVLDRPRRGHPNPLFADHAVLQQGAQGACLGYGGSGETVTVEIAKQSVPARLAPTANGWRTWRRSRPAARSR